MTAQEIFDKVYRHFVIEGNKKSLDSAGECAYRGENGAKCAFGLLISDEQYNPKMEGCRAVPLIMEEEELSEFILHRHLIDNLQRWHDASILNVERIHSIAKEFNLQIPT